LPFISAKTLASNAGQSIFASEYSGDSVNATIEEDLAEFEVYPVPEEEHLESAEAEDEGEDTG
jgi:hypothetical protein